MELKTFKEFAGVEINEAEESWTKADLIGLIEDLEESDVLELSEIVMAFLEHEDEEVVAEGETLDEKKMKGAEKKKAAKLRKGPAFKKAKKMKAKCMEKMGDKVRDSKGKLTCGSDGKVKKGMSKADKIAMAKARKKK